MCISGRIFHPTAKPRCASFAKKKKQIDVVLTNDTWPVTINLDTTTHEEVLSTIKSDMHLVENQKRYFISISHLTQIETLLNTLETKPCSSYKVLPKLDR